MNAGNPQELPTDEQIIRRLRASDPTALEFLVATYWERLVRFVEGIVDQEGGADDVVQEAFIRLWTRRKELKLQGSFRAFLYTMTRNAAIDERRSSGRRKALATKAEAPRAEPSPLSAAEASQLQEVAAAAVDRLPPRRREVFRLVRTEGLSYREVAEVMGLSTQTVANQMSKALVSLHRTLDRVFKDGVPGEHASGPTNTTVTGARPGDAQPGPQAPPVVRGEAEDRVSHGRDDEG
jgi:RNA polymerase sigma-70 factor (ECF subfamily)